MPIIDLLLFALIGLCGVTDIRSGKIYNKVTYPAAAVGLAWNAASGGEAFKSSLQGFLLAAVMMGTLVVMGGMGGGDAKLLAAIGALKGFPFILDSLFYSFLVGGAMALSVAIWQGRLWGIVQRLSRLVFSAAVLKNTGVTNWEDVHSYKIPFGAAIGLGTLWAQVSHLIRLG